MNRPVGADFMAKLQKLRQPPEEGGEGAEEGGSEAATEPE